MFTQQRPNPWQILDFPGYGRNSKTATVLKTPRQSHCSGRVPERVYGWGRKVPSQWRGVFSRKTQFSPLIIISLKPLQCIFMKKYIWVIAFVAIFALPTVAMGGSFVSSLIQGKSPSEAITILGEQLDSLFGRVSTLEVEQANTSQEIEKLKLENENLKLKAEQVSTQTEQIRTNEDRKLRCASLASQIDAKEKVVTQPFKDRVQPLNDELRQLSIQKSKSDNLSPGEFRELRDKIDSLRKQIDAINLEMEKAVDVLKATPEIRALYYELNNVLLCA